MSTLRFRTRLLLGTIFFGVLITVVSMLVVSWAVSRQYMEQASEHSAKDAAIINDNLNERKSNQLIASRQLASQKNLGSTLWYLSQYAHSGENRETFSSLTSNWLKTPIKWVVLQNYQTLLFMILKGNW